MMCNSANTLILCLRDYFSLINFIYIEIFQKYILGMPGWLTH